MEDWMNNSPFPLEGIVEMVGEDKDSVIEILTIFSEDVPDYLSNLKGHMDASEFGPASKVIHTLKSTVSLSGNSTLVATCNKYQIEDVLAQEKSSIIYSEIIEPVQDLLNKANQSLEKLTA